MNAKQLLELIIRPTLKELDLQSDASEQLVLGTIFQESKGVYLKQLGNGPALGLIQMEPATHDDIWRNFLTYHPRLRPVVLDLITAKVGRDFSITRLSANPTYPAADELIYNLKYAVAMCRIHYLRVPAPLPDANNVQALARYWKKYYNTEQGRGNVADFVNNYPSMG